MTNTTQEMLHEFYQELVKNNAWETEHFILSLGNGRLKVQDKRTGVEIILKA